MLLHVYIYIYKKIDIATQGIYSLFNPVTLTNEKGDPRPLVAEDEWQTLCATAYENRMLQKHFV